MQTEKLILGIKNMLSRDEMKKIKAGCACPAPRLTQCTPIGGIGGTCPSGCRCLATSDTLGYYTYYCEP